MNFEIEPETVNIDFYQTTDDITECQNPSYYINKKFFKFIQDSL